MNIFIIGSSGTGKTPIAKKISEALNMKTVKASEYFRIKFNDAKIPFKNRDDFISKITKFSQQILKDDYNININYIKNQMSVSCVIEGIRNPIDFTNIFNFNNDIVIKLNYTKNNLKITEFEDGIDIIGRVCEWAIINKIMPSENMKDFTYDEFFGVNSLEEQVKKFIKDMK